jgi:hypothetical protein
MRTEPWELRPLAAKRPCARCSAEEWIGRILLPTGCAIRHPWSHALAVVVFDFGGDRPDGMAHRKMGPAIFATFRAQCPALPFAQRIAVDQSSIIRR